jgi:hypothetical protein
MPIILIHLSCVILNAVIARKLRLTPTRVTGTDRPKEYTVSFFMTNTTHWSGAKSSQEDTGVSMQFIITVANIHNPRIFVAHGESLSTHCAESFTRTFSSYKASLLRFPTFLFPPNLYGHSIRTTACLSGQ